MESDSQEQMKQVTLFGLKASKYPLDIHLDQKLITYKANSRSSMSGSPLVIKEDKVIGLHKMVFCKSEKCKGARMITTDLIDRVLKWADIMKGSPFVFWYFNSGSLKETMSKDHLFVEVSQHKDSIRKSRVK